MVKEVFFFTEMGYTAYPMEAAEKLGYTGFAFPNSYFDPKVAHDLYHMYFEEYQYAVENGFDGVMINEHHNVPYSMNPSINVTGGILAKIIPRGRIVMLGNILPIHDQPLRLAEEIAMMDVISGGRMVSGFVRGVGTEPLATNTNPVYNRSRFQEAHDLIIKAWTTPGPFRWEGEHFSYRIVNPWVLPIQKPHPPIWIPGFSSLETVAWAARHRYPYIALNIPFDVVSRIWRTYEEAAAEVGYTPTSENFGYSAMVFVQDTDEQAYEEGKKLFWQLGTTFGRTPLHWAQPPGYLSRSAIGQLFGYGQKSDSDELTYEKALATKRVFVGSPETVIKRLKELVDVADPGWLVLWAREGPMSHSVAMRCLDLLGKEVIPAIKEYKPAVEKPWMQAGHTS